jgi:hypothetical protein
MGEGIENENEVYIPLYGIHEFRKAFYVFRWSEAARDFS